VVETKFQVYFQFQAAVHTGFTWGTECVRCSKTSLSHMSKIIATVRDFQK